MLDFELYSETVSHLFKLFESGKLVFQSPPVSRDRPFRDGRGLGKCPVCPGDNRRGVRHRRSAGRRGGLNDQIREAAGGRFDHYELDRDTDRLALLEHQLLLTVLVSGRRLELGGQRVVDR